MRRAFLDDAEFADLPVQVSRFQRGELNPVEIARGRTEMPLKDFLAGKYFASDHGTMNVEYGLDRIAVKRVSAAMGFAPALYGGIQAHPVRGGTRMQVLIKEDWELEEVAP